MSEVDAAVAAILAGRPAVIPTDTVYGLVADPYRDEPARRLYGLKGRAETQPSALMASDVDLLFECVPELRGRVGSLVRALLPGALTLIVPNPARRFRWITGTNHEAIGVRVPDLAGPGGEVLERAGAVVATSANLPGGPDPRRLADVPEELRAGAGAVVDGGELSGVPSTVIDLTTAEPTVVREGAVPSAEVLASVSSASA
jgi:L-threonylcarbamoyladenylate synthase